MGTKSPTAEEPPKITSETAEELPKLASETTPQKPPESAASPNTTDTPIVDSKENPATVNVTPPASRTTFPRHHSCHRYSHASSRTTFNCSRGCNCHNLQQPRWFSFNNIHECELRFLPEFFDGRSPSKNPRVYKYYRNSIIKKYRENPTAKITFTEARKTIIGDVGSVRRIFDFLDTWGLINYSPSPASKLPLKWDDKETKSITALLQGTEPAANVAECMVPKKKLCSGCKSVCSIACFASDKYDLTLCARCYVRGNYRVGVSSSDFRRVEINEDVKTDWSEKEILLLLEATMHYGDDRKKVAEYVGGRSEMECVTRFFSMNQLGSAT
ncbi:hypothetical protein Vadar_024599 [Vaccinium darrowii]|uniref:Uncharacterized protein n=1 Tax=Vaccinium darrowii TaxID=229202 RepID=A0ACB7Z624_9ERIC|nr:hypothetical protein Vadar_024599 [Vaccinium darrowii]